MESLLNTHKSWRESCCCFKACRQQQRGGGGGIKEISGDDTDDVQLRDVKAFNGSLQCNLVPFSTNLHH